ncbi:hypothetical protein I543_1167 [Mycobacteroides abscessus 21]|uniref:IrrE N-terminal-like domain-containing protein n=1 Tax=Mycobacteroides abscessus 21 TaxID=1299324 RepID=A0A829Q991_9MYCO|nr:hypothetical protein I543_1167 [Mycobacteroides abscessus 21]
MNPIDIASAIATAGVELMYRPLPALFGAYLGDMPVKGILVNNRMTRAVRRHTAAHELGHHRLGHGTVYDAGATDDSTAPITVASGSPSMERTAEAFATWFLMPLRAVRTALRACGFSPPLSAAQVYQLSLRLGTTYTATARHLVSLRLAEQQQSREWAAIPPGRLKRQLAGEALGSTRDVDVWDLSETPAGSAPLVASPGDVLIVPAQHGTPTAEDGLIELGDAGAGRWALQCDPAATASQTAVDTPSGPITVRVAPRPVGSFVVGANDTDGV